MHRYKRKWCTNFQWVGEYPFEINTGTQAAVYHNPDTPSQGMRRTMDSNFTLCKATSTYTFTQNPTHQLGK